MRDVVVTGIGPVLPGCSSREDFWRQLSEGRSQLAIVPDPADPTRTVPIGRVDVAHARSLITDIPDHFLDRYHPEILLYLASLHVARQDAGLRWELIDPRRTGLFDGSARPTLAFWYERVRSTAAIHPKDAYSRRDMLTCIPGQTVGIAASVYGLRGPTYTVNATCSSGAVAIGHAWREVAIGEVDLAFATGHEWALVAPVMAMYRDAGLISKEDSEPERALSPYVDHSTNVFGDGAVTLVLESREHAEKRGANILCSLGAYRHGNSGFHPTAVDPLAIRPTQLVTEVVEAAGLVLEDVKVVVGHGNGVPVSDVSEENYMRRLFGRRAAEVPLVSVKPIYGHSLGASSATNAAAAALMVHHDYIAPTINAAPNRTRRYAQHQGEQGRSVECQAAVSVSYGMGGQNAALLFKK